jgi:hypothetical protein
MKDMYHRAYFGSDPPKPVVLRAIWNDAGVEALFESIRHGDEAHQKWLHDKLWEFFHTLPKEFHNGG